MLPQAARTEAFRRIYQANYGAIVAYARRRLGEQDADEAVADVFLVTWRRLDEVPEGDLTLPWLYGVARRVVSQGQRTVRRKHRLLARLATLGSREPKAASETERIDEHQAVQSALAKLRPTDQELLRLSVWEELGATELAVIYGCSTNAIAIRLHRAHRRLGKIMRAFDEERHLPQQERT